MTWLPVHLGIGGGFDVLLPENPGKAWLWWFSDLSNVALGAVHDDLGKRQPDTMTLPLPPFATPAVGGPAEGGPGRVPVDITESELADDPDVFTEDPAFCRPFSNPERVLGERAFHVILRQSSRRSAPNRRASSRRSRCSTSIRRSSPSNQRRIVAAGCARSPIEFRPPLCDRQPSRRSPSAKRSIGV